MKKVKTTLLKWGALGAFIFMSSGFPASAHAAANMSMEKKKAIHTSATQALQKAKQKINDDAVNGIQLSYKALSEMSNDNMEEARASLVDASSAFEKAASENEDFVTISVNVNLDIGVETPKEAKDLISLAEDAISNSNPQAARDFLGPLVSEIDIIVTDIPVGIFKDFTDKAIVSVDKKEKDKAEQYLLDAMETAIFVSEVIPVPTLFANMDLDAASDVVATDPDTAVRLLKDAEQQLALNDILGYNQSNAFQQKYKTDRKRIMSAYHHKVWENIKNKLSLIKTNNDKNKDTKQGKQIEASIGKIEKASQKAKGK